MCNNVINITGNKKDLLKFKMDFKGTLHEGKITFLDFVKIIDDESEELKDEWNKSKEMQVRYNNYYSYWFNKIGFHKHQKIWGTKWNSICSEPTEYKDSLTYIFDTAWSPCTPIVKELIKTNKHLNFDYEYEETGECFAGQIKSDGGKILIDESHNIDTSECPLCECSNIKNVADEEFVCCDCGHKYILKDEKNAE